MDQNLEIPRLLRYRPRWNGLPIPYTTFIGADGSPDFKVNDEMKRLKCMKDRLCGLCGSKLKTIIVFIGGKSCVQYRMFIDPPMHEECAKFATAACPFLANAHGRYATCQPKHLGQENTVYLTYNSVAPERPAQMAMYYTSDYSARATLDGGYVFQAMLPVKVDFDAMPKRE